MYNLYDHDKLNVIKSQTDKCGLEPWDAATRKPPLVNESFIIGCNIYISLKISTLAIVNEHGFVLPH